MFKSSSLLHSKFSRHRRSSFGSMFYQYPPASKIVYLRRREDIDRKYFNFVLIESNGMEG